MNLRLTAFALLLAVLFSSVGCSTIYEESDGAELPAPSEDIENIYADEEWTNLVVYPDATILTMAAWAPSPSLQSLITNFNQTHSDYQIELKIYYEGYSSEEDAYAAINRMSMEMISGNTPDLFSFNGMNTMALINSGLVMDLYPLMEQDSEFHMDDYFSNVWDSFAVNGCLYEWIPTFRISGLLCPASEAEERQGFTYSEWLALCDGLDYPLNVDQTGMLDYMVFYSGKDFLDIQNATCSFDSDAFLQWMEVVKSAPDSRPGTDTQYKDATWVNGVTEYAQAIHDHGTDVAYLGFPSSGGTGVSAAAMDSYGI